MIKNKHANLIDNRASLAAVCFRIFAFSVMSCLAPIASSQIVPIEPDSSFNPGEPFQISALRQPLGHGAVLSDYEISSDKRYVVYRARNNRSGEIDLYAASLDLGFVLSYTLVANGEGDGDVTSFKISSDSSKIVYVSDTALGDALRMVNIDASGSAQRLSNTQATGFFADISDYEISPDSSRVVYRTDFGLSGTYRLMSVLLTSPFSRDGVGPQVSGLSQSVEADFEFIPNTNNVVYRGNLRAVTFVELFASGTNGDGDRQILNGRLGLGANVELPDVGLIQNDKAFSITPTGSHVVYHADARMDGVYELYSTSLDLSLTKVRLNPNDLASNEDIIDHKISPDGTRVTYRANSRDSSKYELFIAPITEAVAARRISGDLVTGGNVFDFVFNPNGTRVIYRANQDQANQERLYAASVVGGGVVSLTPDTENGTDVQGFKLDEFGSRVVYDGTDAQDGRGLYSISINGEDKEQLNPPSVGLFRSRNLILDKARDRILYLSGSVFSSPIDGLQTTIDSVKVSVAPRVDDFKLSDDSQLLVYRAINDGSFSNFDLYAVDMEGGSENESETCFPIKASNGNLAVVCL